MTHPIQCECGALQGKLSEPHRAIRGVCYCKDCRAYSNHLGKLNVHDELGGVDFVATQSRYVTFTRGIENLACISLSPKGSLRWYAKCCNTAIGATARDWKLPYIGLVHSCLKSDAGAYENTFPEVKMRVNSKSAHARPPSMGLSNAIALMTLIPRILMGKANGSYRTTPFFTAGVPRVDVKVLSLAEKEAAYRGI
jgi:hypothetical protein